MSNSAAMVGQDTAYLVWGVNNDTHELTDTTFDYHVDVKNEPLEHYLARQIIPDINFEFHEFKISKKRVVVLVIPAAKQVPTAWNGARYLRIGSSKVNLNKYPERKSRLFDILRNGLPTLETVEAYTQELTFRKLFLYYEEKGIVLNRKTFEQNLGLRTQDGKYNLMAQLLSITVRFLSGYLFSEEQIKPHRFIQSVNLVIAAYYSLWIRCWNMEMF